MTGLTAPERGRMIDILTIFNEITAFYLAFKER
jgi:hypothetical protein